MALVGSNRRAGHRTCHIFRFVDCGQDNLPGATQSNRPMDACCQYDHSSVCQRACVCMCECVMQIQKYTKKCLYVLPLCGGFACYRL